MDSSTDKFGFEELDVWKKSRTLKQDIASLIKQFPTVEKFRLKDQIIRSSRSIGSLISEGHGRFTYPDQIHFCVQARGSLTETRNHIIDALDANYISEDILNSFRIKVNKIERLLNGYLSYLRKQRNS